MTTPEMHRDSTAHADADLRPREVSAHRDIPRLDQARVTTAYADCAVRTAQEFGADMAALGAASGLDFAAGLPEEIPVRAYLAFLDAAATQLNEPLFGLQVGLRSRVIDAKAYSMVLMACRNVRSVVEQTSRFEPLAHDLGRSELLERDGVAHYRVHSPWTQLPGARHFFDYAAAGVRAQANWITATKLPVFRFSTTFDPPIGVSKEAYERALGGAVQFGAEFNEVTFPAALLSLPIPGADGSVFAMLKQIAEGRLAIHLRRRDAQILTQVRERLREQIQLGRATLPEIAAVMGVAPRTLQRKLADAQATFGGLLDEVRREEAKRHLLDRDLSLTEVALLLGYSEQSAFNHAFRGWFGATPGRYRQALFTGDIASD